MNIIARKKRFGLLIILLFFVVLIILLLNNFSFYYIVSDSMSPTLMREDLVIIHKNSVVKLRDIVVFRFPLNDSLNKLVPQCKKIYIKRCVGLPGEMIEIRNGFFINNSLKGESKDIIKKLNLSSDNFTINNSSEFSNDRPLRKKHRIKELAPSVIPRIGKRVSLSPENIELYKLCIEYETSEKIVISDTGNILLRDKVITEYTFSKNYFFFCGDNLSSSYDSRYWGFVPEEFVIGIVCYIMYQTPINWT